MFASLLRAQNWMPQLVRILPWVPSSSPLDAQVLPTTEMNDLRRAVGDAQQLPPAYHSHIQFMLPVGADDVDGVASHTPESVIVDDVAGRSIPHAFTLPADGKPHAVLQAVCSRCAIFSAHLVSFSVVIQHTIRIHHARL